MTSFLTGKHFDEIKDDNVIAAIPYLESCKIIPKLIENYGTVFSPIKADVQNNIDLLSKTVEKDPSVLTTLKSIIENDIKNKATKPPSATSSLLWLNRACMYVFACFSLISDHCKKRKNSTEEISTTLNKLSSQAYEQTLRRHHNTVAILLFKAASLALPNLDVFLKSLMNEEKEEKLIEDMDLFLNSLRPVIDTICSYYRDLELENEEFTFTL